MTIDRTQWPWHAAPADVDDYDAAVWHAVRSMGKGEFPVQSLEAWLLRQRASRDIWPWLEPKSVGLEQLRADIAEAWAERASTISGGSLAGV